MWGKGMIGAPGGLNSAKYDNNASVRKKRRRSLVRKINERWQSEYGIYRKESINKPIPIIDEKELLVKSPKDDGDSFKHMYRTSLISDEDSIKEGKSEMCKKSFVENETELQCDYTSKFKDKRESMFQIIAEVNEEDNTTSNRLTSQKNPGRFSKYSSTSYEHKLAIGDSAEVRRRSLNNLSRASSDPGEAYSHPIKGILVTKDSQRKTSPLNIQGLGPLPKPKKNALSFQTNRRTDAGGNLIEPGGHYKVMFCDEVSESKRHSIASTHEVESYKKYNQDTKCCDTCCGIF